MSIVDQAAKRLEQLRRAGIAVPGMGHDPSQAATPQPSWTVTPSDPTPVAAMRRLAAEAANAAGTAQSSVAERPRVAATPADGAATQATQAIRTIHVGTAPPSSSPRPAQSGQIPAPAPRLSATIDLERLQLAGYLVPSSSRTQLAEELRHIKRPLLKNVRDEGSGALRLAQIMVTSALPGEGKTFFSINLAMSMAAEIDTSVLLVDADFVHPTLLQRLGVHAGPGLLDVLTDPGLDVADFVMATNVPKLSILAAGSRNDRATELLASHAMERLLETLAERYPRHIVIFDAPPLLVTNEAKVLAAHVGQVVMVVEAEKTPKTLVAQAFASVEHCPVVLSVLNKVPESQTPLGYGYYYP